MNESNWQLFARSTLALMFVAGSACDSGLKQIGSLDDGSGATETQLGDGDPDPVEEELGETGEACMGADDPIECAAPQGIDIDIEFSGNLLPAPDLGFTCAANLEPKADGYRVVLTHCTNSEGHPQPDGYIHLSGDWSAPELADGDQPLTEIRLMERYQDVHGYTARMVLMRPTGDLERISLLAYMGTELETVLIPTWLSPLVIQLDGAGCLPNPITCTAQTQHQEYRIGFRVSYGCSEAIVTDDTMLSNFGIEEGTGIAYDVLVGFAKTHECEPDGNFHELMLGIVGRTH